LRFEFPDTILKGEEATILKVVNQPDRDFGVTREELEQLWLDKLELPQPLLHKAIAYYFGYTQKDQEAKACPYSLQRFIHEI